MPDLFDLTGRVAMVTGGSRGPGRQMALAFADAGADGVTASRKQDACDAVAQEVRDGGRKALAAATHVGRWDELDRLVDTACAEFGRVDVLVDTPACPCWRRPPRRPPKSCSTRSARSTSRARSGCPRPSADACSTARAARSPTCRRPAR